jgi:hypothetical protein
VQARDIIRIVTSIDLSSTRDCEKAAQPPMSALKMMQLPKRTVRNEAAMRAF